MTPNKRINTDPQQRRFAPLLWAGYARRTFVREHMSAGTAIMRFAARMDRQYLRGGFYPEPLTENPIPWGGVRR
jgi:hypothetical protein